MPVVDNLDFALIGVRSIQINTIGVNTQDNRDEIKLTRLNIETVAEASASAHWPRRR